MPANVMLQICWLRVYGSSLGAAAARRVLYLRSGAQSANPGEASMANALRYGNTEQVWRRGKHWRCFRAAWDFVHDASRSVYAVSIGRCCEPFHEGEILWTESWPRVFLSPLRRGLVRW